MPHVEVLTANGVGVAARDTARAADVAAALRAARPPAVEGRFVVPVAVPGGCFALDCSGRPTLLVPVDARRPLVGREIGGLRVAYEPRIRFAVDGKQWESAAAALSCRDDALLPTFCALGLDVASRVAGPDLPSARAVSSAVDQWERLLRIRHRLTAHEECGLWGELWLLSRMENADLAVAAWRGPDRAAVDFLFGGVALECKTSTQRLRHDVSQQQLERPAGDAETYLVSLWLAPDPGGETLPDLVQRIDEQVSESAAFETKLLAWGYSRLDASLYRQRFTPLEAPLVFPTAAVPRVRAADAGVSAIRFTVTLDESRAVDEQGARVILRGPCVS